MIPRRAADQVINSASSALYSIGLVWVTDDATLGAAAIALTAQPLLLGVLRTAVSEGLLMRARTDDDHESVAWIPAAAGVAAGVLGALVTFAVGLAVGLTSSTAGALAAVTLGVLVVDGLRFTAFLAGNDGRALTADAIWLGLSGLGLAVDIRSGGVGLGALSCWYAIGSFAASISLAPILQTIRRGPLPQWVRKEARFGADFVLQAVPGQATLILASAVASFAAVGQLRAAVTLYNPLTTALYALRLTILDRLAPGRRLAIIYGGAAAVYSGLLVTSFHFVPQLTSRPLGAISLAMLVYTGAGEVGRHATQGLVDGFRSSGDLRSPLLLRGAQAVALLTLTLGLGSLADAGLGAARAVAFCFPAIVGALLVQPAKTDRYDVRLK